MRRAITRLGIVAVLVFGICKTQNILMGKTSVSWKAESFSYLPDNRQIGDFLLGYKTTLSHYLWIKTVIYFGGHYISDKHYTWIVNMLDIITKLNPYFYPAYEFAGVLLPDITGNPDMSRILLERGLTNLRIKQWNIAFHMGMLYYLYYNDNSAAARYIELASRAPGAPKEKLVGLAATLYRKSGQEEYAFSYLKMMYETSDNPEVKRQILEKIDKFLRDGMIK